MNRPRIAVIDDDADFRSVLRVQLRSRFDTMSYESAEEWLADDEDAIVPDLIITDLKMPGLNGFKLCETLRSRPRYASVPILFLTGVDSEDAWLLGREAGADAYLVKPVEASTLLEKIESLLAIRR